MPGGILFFSYQFNMTPFCHIKTVKREKDETVFYCSPGEIRTNNGATKWQGGTIQNLIIFHSLSYASPFKFFNSRN